MGLANGVIEIFRMTCDAVNDGMDMIARTLTFFCNDPSERWKGDNTYCVGTSSTVSFQLSYGQYASASEQS